jgi:hypothetical protein
MQRLTSGLPRGWSALVLSAFLYFFLTRNFNALYVVLLFGCLLHPPTTMICGFAFGSWLLFQVVFSAERRRYLKPFWTLAILTPVYALITLSVVQRPDYIGSMVTLEEAREIPEFQFPGGRFPFVPLQDLEAEVRTFAYQAFIGRFHRGAEGAETQPVRPHPFMRDSARTIVLVCLFGLFIVSLWPLRGKIPTQLWFLAFSVTVIYLAAREFAFLLYVPNRHLQFPLALFFIVTFSIGFWHVGLRIGQLLYKPAQHVFASIALLLLAAFIYANSGDGLKGDLNFNYPIYKRGDVFTWLRENTAEDVVVAGHPTFIDGVMLFAQRRGFITTETYHPFYPEYMLEARRRVNISLRAHYARNLQELYELLKDERIDYFVFERARFYKDALEKNTYQLPHTQLAQELGARHWTEYAFRAIPRELDLRGAPYQVFRDSRAVIIDIRALGQWLDTREALQSTEVDELNVLEEQSTDVREEAVVETD